MRSCRMQRNVTLEAGAYILLALMVFLLPLKWIFAALLAGLVHELCHVLAIRLCGGRILSVEIGAGGAVIRTDPMDSLRELVCALAGPLGGLILLLFARWLPRTAICAGLQSAYNLLPLYPLDGGRALRCGALLVLPPKTADRFCYLVQIGCLCAIVLLGIYGTFFLRLGVLPILIALLLLRKIPCKPWRQRVQ